ncbi:hypothetical protein B0F90DRAFT_49129 [Multifurca ochricompacta]|uniref:Integral membrane protein n=1 Tax=Multifurca ochricompacta TaxID=376703 RepID=A0AAD4MC94_9AGAM|nr:hypothetical protein B0F90DRAFT_49129 [Multifurca ochricompacta]
MARPSSQVTKNPLFLAYLNQLSAHPLRTKALTTGTLCFLQEVLGSHLANLPVQKPAKDAPFYSRVLTRAKVDSRAVKMALYGLLVSAPLGHFLVGQLQKAFAGKSGRAAKLGQVVASNLIVAPIQTIFYLSSLAVVSGAQSWNDVKKTVKGGFFPVIKVMWVSSPLSIAFAQNFLSPELWVPFFNLVSFVLGTYFNTKLKRLRRSAEKKNDDKSQ